MNIVSEVKRMKYAYIFLPNGNMIEVKVNHFNIYQSYVAIAAKDGREYRVSMKNCLLTSDRLEEVKE